MTSDAEADVGIVPFPSQVGSHMVRTVVLETMSQERNRDPVLSPNLPSEFRSSRSWLREARSQISSQVVQAFSASQFGPHLGHSR